MRERLSQSALRSGVGYWLIDLEWAGRTWRLSTHDVDVQTEDGDWLPYAGALDAVKAEEGIRLFEESSAINSVPITAVLPGADVPRLVHVSGFRLELAKVTISRWVSGTTYEARRVLLAGRVADPKYGAKDEPISFSIEANAWEDTAVFPSSSAAVLAENWSDEYTSLAEGRGGLAYPVVVGHPGVVSTSTVSSVGWITGSRAVWVDERAVNDSGNVAEVRVVLAGHHVSATNVRAVTDSASSTAAADSRFVVRNGYDDGGNPIAYIPWFVDLLGTSPSPGPAPDDDWDSINYHYDYAVTDAFGELNGLGVQALDPSYNTDGQREQIYVAWRDELDSTAGGLQINGETARGAGTVLQWLLEQLSRPVDTRRCRVAAAGLDAIKVDFCVDAQTKVWEWIRANLIPILPVSIVTGADGIHTLLWRYDATADDAVARIDADADGMVERVSGLSVDSSKIVNEVTVRYAYSIRSGVYMGSHTAGAANSYHAKLSQDRYRTEDGKPLVSPKVIESICIYDDASAKLIADWILRAYAFAQVRVSYRVPERRYGTLARGDVVKVADSEMYMSDRLALVESIATGAEPGMLRLDLLMIEQPERDNRYGSLTAP